MESKNRDIFVDVAKGIGMLMVVRIHTEVFSTISCPYPIIAVPFFFFLSGFYDDSYKPLKEWFPKTFRRLFGVGVIWMLIGFVYLSLLSYIKDRTVVFNFSIENPIIADGVVWFLFALFYSKMLMWVIHRIKIPCWVTFTMLIILGGVFQE